MSSGPIPSSGAIAPWSTWYTPLKLRARSIAIRSAGPSTTQITSRSRAGSIHIAHCGVSERPRHSLQRPTRSFISSSASASAITSLRERLSRLKARRDAVFSPIPGRRDSSFTSRVIAGGSPSLRLRFSAIADRCGLAASAEKPGKVQAAHRRQLAHLLRHHLLRPLQPGVDRHGDKVLEHLLVVRGEQRRIDLDAPHAHRTVHDDLNHTAAARGLDGPFGDLLLCLLEFLLQGLRLLHQVRQIEWRGIKLRHDGELLITE